MLPCPSCSRETPDVLMCPCDAPTCPDCCNREHPRRCPDCHAQGVVNVTRAAKATYGAFIPGHLIGPGGRDLFATCGTCEGHGTKNLPKENQ